MRNNGFVVVGGWGVGATAGLWLLTGVHSKPVLRARAVADVVSTA